MRHALLLAFVSIGVATALVTEFLSLVGLLTPLPLLAGWLFVGGLAALLVYRSRSRVVASIRFAAIEWVLLASVAFIAGAVGLTAILSPPNSHDALAYHLPRVVYWAQSGSVEFFPTQYLNQISMPPLAEYMALHTYLLSGGDHLVNLVQWLFFLGNLCAASLIGRELGAERRGQILTVVVCATLPTGILQASSAKNEWVLTFWLTALLYFALRFCRSHARQDLIWLGLALGLALLTKGTAYLFAPPLILGALLPDWRQAWKPLLAGAPLIALPVLVLNGPHYWRNLTFSGSPLGYDSAHGDGAFRWRNDRFGAGPTVSNLLRHVSDQLGTGSERWNQRVYDTVAELHTWLGIDLNDPATTWQEARFSRPRNTNHEADANNRWHLLLLLVCTGGLLVSARSVRGAFGLLVAYGGGLFLALLMFCFYLKWAPYQARMALSLFVLAAPLAGLWLERIRPAAAGPLVCLLLLWASGPYLFENWLRRLTGPGNLFAISRADAYFNDMGQWHSKESYVRSAQLTAASGCNEIGIDTTQFELEYPYQALVLEANPAARFQHVGVTNQSLQFRKPGIPLPCAVLCLNCAGSEEKQQQFASTGEPIRAGESLLFLE